MARSFRISLHPAPLAPLTEHFAAWSRYLRRQLERLPAATRDPVLVSLAEEIETWPIIPDRRAIAPTPATALIH